MPKHDPFSSIATADLDRVAGGASRVSSRTGAGNEQITQITSSIKDLAGAKSSGMDPMMMMVMMMMGGGGGSGGGAAAAAAPPPPPPPAINVSITSGG